MINSWSLLYDELYGEDDMTDNTITSLESDEYDPKPKSDSDESDWNEPVITVGSGNTASAGDSTFNINLDTITDVSIDTSGIEEINLNVDPDYIAPEFVNFSLDGVGFVNDSTPEKPQTNLDYKPQKYEEDKGIADLKNYVTSTYRGHYTSEQNNTQTLDLIQSVGDAESFCRSNALKYLARYDKKGSAKQDILKAMHYCLLLYYFSGNTKEPDYTNTRYETF